MSGPRPGQVYREIETEDEQDRFTDEQEPHFTIIISREEYNRGEYVLAIPITSKKFETRSQLPNCVPFQAGQFGFSQNCVAKAERLALYDKADLDLNAGPIGVLDDQAMGELVKAVGHVMSAVCFLAE